MSTQPAPDRSSAELLEVLREHEDVKREVEVASVRHIVAWAELNTVDAPEDAATISDGFVDTGVPIAGEGAPWVSEFGLMELCAVVGRSTAGGREYVGKVLETAYRLPSVWQGVLDGRIPVWRALRIADGTRLLPADAAAYVDHHLATFAATCTFAQVDRLVEEALARFDPDTAEERRREAVEGRRFDVHTDEAGIEGTVAVDGVLDVADGLDLDAAIGQRAEELAHLGSTESRDVRRARAAGELARADQTLDYEPVAGPKGTAGAPTPASGRAEAPEAFRKRPGRRIELHVHLTDTALTGGETVGRLANTRSPITAEQIKAWCGTPGTTVIVRPVVDLAGHEPVEAYEIPERHRRQVRLRDPHCGFPRCGRPRACRVGANSLRRRSGVTQGAELAPTRQRRPTHGGATPCSTPAPTCGPAPPGTSSSSTTAAPGISARSITGLPSDIDPAPHPAHHGGVTGVSRRCEVRGAGARTWLATELRVRAHSPRSRHARVRP